jgi:hypothetical protein
MTTIAAGDVSEMNGDTVDDAADALLARFMPEGDPDAPKKKEPSEEGEPKKKTETPAPKPEDDDADDEETPAPDDEDEGDKPAEKKHVDDDEAYVKIKEGDDEHEVPVKDLKRLWGQEAALTRKSQEVAEARKTAEAETVKTTTVLSALLQRAKTAAEPYSKIDFIVASKSLTAEELTALRAETNTRLEEVKFLETELGNFMQAINTKKQTDFVAQAKACVATLKDADSPHHIPDWGDKVYGELREFAVAEGLDNNVFNNLVDPASMKLLNMAMQFKRGLSKVVTTKVNKTPKKIVKSSSAPVQTKGSKAAEDKAMNRLKSDQSTEAAADVFLKRWEAKAGDNE